MRSDPAEPFEAGGPTEPAEPAPVVRTVTSADLATVADIYRHFVDATVVTFDLTAPTRSDWERKAADIRERGLPFLVLEVDGTVAGFAYAAQYRPKAAYGRTVENSIYLSPAWVGKGLGKPLLAALLAALEQTDVREVVAVIADTGNDASVRLHLASGFTEVGRLRGVGYKHEQWVDTLLLQRRIGG